MLGQGLSKSILYMLASELMNIANHHTYWTPKFTNKKGGFHSYIKEKNYDLVVSKRSYRKRTNLEVNIKD